MKTRSANCPVPQLLASVGVGALGAVLSLPPHLELERFPLQGSLYCRTKLVHWRNGLQWTEVGWVHGSVSWVQSHWAPMEKGFLKWLHAGGTTYFLAPFMPFLMDRIHQGGTGSSFQQSFQTLSQHLAKLKKCVILSAVWMPVTTTCSHDTYKCQTWHGLIFFWQDHSVCIMAVPGQEWISVWVMWVMQTVLAWGCASGDSQHPRFPIMMVGRLEEESRWNTMVGRRMMNLKHLGSPGHTLQLVLAKGCQGFCSPVFGRAVVSSLPNTDRRGL